ncbi:MAG TPA: prolipoprotein diacylglyceryl transferase [Chryseolinea sp.]|nr:prolipoprotein diacylglyceryl transferase [Chryseolinea sp.]
MLSYVSWDFDPVIFDLAISGHDWSLRWYGVLFALGFVIAQQVLFYVFTRDGKSRQSVDILTIYLIVAAIVGARLGHYLFYEWPLLIERPADWIVELITPPFAGLASHGGMIAILLAVYLYSRRYKDQPYLWVLDRLAIAAPVSGAMIRLGNLFNSEIYGTPTDMPWGFVFVRETDPALFPLVPRHPTQIYESLFCVFLFLLALYLWKTRRHSLPNGVIFGIFMTLLFTSRFVIEFVKNDQVEFEGNYPLNMGQLLSLPAIAIGVAVILYVYRAGNKDKDKPIQQS